MKPESFPDLPLQLNSAEFKVHMSIRQVESLEAALYSLTNKPWQGPPEWLYLLRALAEQQIKIKCSYNDAMKWFEAVAEDSHGNRMTTNPIVRPRLQNTNGITVRDFINQRYKERNMQHAYAQNLVV